MAKSAETRYDASCALAQFPEALTAVVVGASRGIGHGLAESLIAHPRCGRVFALCRRPDEVRFNASIEPVEADVMDEASLRAAAETVQAAAGGVHLLLYSAGLLHGDSSGEAGKVSPERSLEQIDPAAAIRSFQINALGAILTAKHFGRMATHADHALMGFLSARVGSISDNRLGGWYAYRASKAAENQFVRTAAIELKRKRGPVCIALHPGTVDTDLSAPFQGNVPADQLFGVQRAANQLLSVVSAVQPHDTGSFYAWDGQPIAW